MQQQASIAVLSHSQDITNTITGALQSASRTILNLAISPDFSMSHESSSTHFFGVDPRTDSDQDALAALGWGANAVLLVIDSSQGIDGDTIRLAQRAFLTHPGAICITGLESVSANFDETLAVCARLFGADHRVVALTLPILDESEKVNGTLNLVTEDISWHVDGDLFEVHDLDEEHVELTSDKFQALIDCITITTLDEQRAESLLQGESITSQDLLSEIERACSSRELLPVFALEPPVGLDAVLDLLSEVGSAPWIPSLEAPIDASVATYCGNEILRVWQGVFTTGEFDTDRGITRITELRTMKNQPIQSTSASELYRITCNPEPAIGSAIYSRGHKVTIHRQLDEG